MRDEICVDTASATTAAPFTEGFVTDFVSCVYSDSHQVSLVVNAEQTEVTDISIEVRERLIDPLRILLKSFCMNTVVALLILFITSPRKLLGRQGFWG